MRWFKKPVRAAIAPRDAIEAVTPSVSFNGGILDGKIATMHDSLAVFGGTSALLSALQTKQVFFERALSREALASLDAETLAGLMDCVFSARRRSTVVFARVPFPVLRDALERLIYGDGTLDDRVQAFAALVEGEERKVRRSLWDFAAEVLHFRAPEQYPLMARWVWDAHAQSGALRELIRGNDTMPNIAIGNTAADFEGVRLWLVSELGARGYYRDLHFLVDLVLAQSYADYVLAMSSGMGMLGSAFGGQIESGELVAKILGVDARRVAVAGDLGALVH